MVLFSELKKENEFGFSPAAPRLVAAVDSRQWGHADPECCLDCIHTECRCQLDWAPLLKCCSNLVHSTIYRDNLVHLLIVCFSNLHLAGFII